MLHPTAGEISVRGQAVLPAERPDQVDRVRLEQIGSLVQAYAFGGVLVQQLAQAARQPLVAAYARLGGHLAQVGAQPLADQGELAVRLQVVVASLGQQIVQVIDPGAQQRITQVRATGGRADQGVVEQRAIQIQHALA